MAADIVEPRTNNQIMADLLQLTIDDQWGGETNMACHCHPEYVRCCRECGVLEYPYSNYTGKTVEHEFGCSRMKLIEEARALLRVENMLAEERGEDTVYVP